MFLRGVAGVGLLVYLVGCQAGPTGDPASYAIAHRELPADFLKRAGAPRTYGAMPFICGGIVESTGIPAPPPLAPEPKYVVDLTKVEEVRTAWMGGKKITVIRHPYAEKNLGGWSSEHPQPPGRLNVRGNSLCGCGPISIWSGAEYLYFTDDPWILLDVPGEPCPWLLGVLDHHLAGGPIEIWTVSTSKERLGNDLLLWIDSAATGLRVEMIVQPSARGRATIKFVQWDRDGHQKDVGVIAFDRAQGQFAYTDLDTPTRAPGTE